VDNDSVRLNTGVVADLSVPSDPRSFLEALTRLCLEKNLSPRSEWLAEAQHRRDECRAQIAASARHDDGLHAVHVVDALKEVTTEETIVLVDGGSIGQWFHQLFCDRYPGRYVTCGASGVVGYGIPGAMAAKTGYPDRPVILLSGDGSMTFTIADLECAARQGLPFVAIVADDESWGIAETGQIKELGRAISSTLGTVQFDVVAQGFGCYGIRISHPGEIAPALREALAADKPTVIHAPIIGGFPQAG
jgi:acetolactate synthase-1/2/3 large subunit